jgi:hypothetical protein
VRRSCQALALVALTLAAGGCGADYPDLMLVERSGSLPGARLTLLVNDGGTVRCNGGREIQMPPRPLLDAREIVRELELESAEDLVLPRRPGALLRFRLESEHGSVTFSDVDAARRPKLGRLVAFTRTVAQDVCGLVR